jgi:hypothetical protein
MFIVLITIFIFGIGIGFIQGNLDPERHKYSYIGFLEFQTEL